MSLLSAIILPHLEKELIALEPQAAEFLLSQLESAGSTVMDWIKTKGKVAAAAIPPSALQ